MKKLCRKSGKVKFDMHEQSAKRAGEVLNAPKRLSDPVKRTTQLSIYRCPFCLKFHMTKGGRKD